MCTLWLCIVSLFGLIGLIVADCGSRPAGRGCRTNNNDYANDTEVYPTAVLNCRFAGSLCYYRQGCVDDEMERWKANLGYASVKQNSTGCGGSVYSILESPLVNFSTPSCVEFTYDKGNLPYQLHVFLAFNNGTLPSSKYNFTEASTNENCTSRFDVKCLTGKIQFRAKGGGPNANTALPKLYHVRIIDGSCANLDQATSAPTHTASTSEQGTRNWIENQCPMSTETMAPDGDVDNSAATIAVVIVIVVVVLIVVIIIGIIVCRRKRHRGKSDDTEVQSTPAGGNTATERRGNPFSRRDGDYTNIDVATTPSSDINPYERADGDTNANGSLGPNMQRLNGTNVLEDDYSRIDEAQPAAAQSREKNTTPVKPNPNDVYSVVNKPGKKTPTPEYSLAKIVGEKPTQPNPKDVYSVVNKKGKTFEPAAKPEQPDTEYNTISHNGNNTSSQKAPGGAPPDTYNRISAVPSLGLNEKGRATTNPEDGLLTDDYNKLNLAANGSVKEKNGAAGAAYDHVRNDPDDAYSKARIGKRNVVIDSDYHHLKP